MEPKSTVKITLKPYLKDFMLSVYGKEQPITLPAKDRFNDLLQLLLCKVPAKYQAKAPVKEYLEILIPKSVIDALNSYTYLSPAKEKEFIKSIKSAFNITFEEFVDKHMSSGISKLDAISIFIDKYELRSDKRLESMLIKYLYRSKRISRKYPKRAYIKTSLQE